MTAPTPASEVARLAALEALGILGSPAEPVFDSIVQLLAQISGTPIALISLVTRDAQWFKASVGLPGVESTPRDIAFCAHAIVDRSVLVVPDAAHDPRFEANPLVTGDPHIRFYAGAPLITGDGHALGTLCAIDRVPRVLSAAQLATLQQLASIVTALIEARADRHALAATTAELEVRERQLQTIADNVPALIGYVDAAERVQYANRQSRDFMIATGDYRGMPLRKFIGHQAYSAARSAIQRALAGERVTHQRTLGSGPDERHHEVTYIPDVDSAGTVRGFYGLTYDLTDHVRRDEALRASEQRLQTLFSAMAEGLVVQARDGRIIDANAAAEVVLGLTRDELLGKKSVDPDWRAIREDGSPFPGEEHPAMVTLRTGRPRRNQIMGVRYAGQEPRWISINSQPLPAQDSADAAAVICTFVDVTAQRQAFEQIRALAQRLESVREDERRSIAQSLHEGVAQDLFAMSLTLKFLETESKGRAGVQSACSELAAALEKCMADTRQVANDLHPVALAHLSVSQVLREHARYFGALSGLRIEVSEQPPFPALDESTRLLLFRAAQEALTNVARHAQATAVSLVLRADAERAEIVVSDNGVGIDANARSKPGSLGLLGMRERFRAVGGGMTIERGNLGGTTLCGYVPLAAA